MYSTKSGLVLGFHGCDQAVADKVISSGDNLLASTNRYDWLGNGIYFWEQSPDRALDYATELQQNPGRSKNPIKAPAVIGAVIDLGFCLDLVTMGNLGLLARSYETLQKSYATAGLDLPRNKPSAKSGTQSADLLRRELDCLVIEALHDSMQQEKKPEFDSVRGVFWEGEELYPNAGFRAKNHIQLCIRNPNCIKGYFRPRELDNKHSAV
jgi:hypothetical protein